MTDRRAARRVDGAVRSFAMATAAAVAVLAACLWALEAGAQAPPTTLAQFHAQYGEDARASYARLRIPAIGLDAGVSRHEVALDDTRVPNPHGPGDVAWYDFETPYFGGAPGAGRNAVFSAHVDYNAVVPHAGVRYQGPGAFADLDRLRAGDIVEVTRRGRTYRYAVSWTRMVRADNLQAWSPVIEGGTPIDSVTLYTCDGIFDGRTRSYSHRLVVRAELLEGTPRRFGAPIRGFSVGRSGTTHPAALASAQRWPVDAMHARRPDTDEWLLYRPGAPTFANTLLGHLRADSLVIMKFADR